MIRILPALLALATFCEPDPPLTELHRFPGALEATAGWSFSCAARQWLREQWEMYPARGATLRPLLDRARYWHATWDALDDAHRTYNNDCFRRHRLARLRDLLGPDAWFAGRMPTLAWGVE